MRRFTTKKQRYYARMISLFLVLVMAIILTVLLLLPTKEEPKEYTMYRVRTGDTLWEIARRECNRGGEMDTRLIIEDILEESEVGDQLHPGDVLYIPQY